MTDFTHHTLKLLTEADAAADLAGLPRPGDLPSVGTEDARSLANEMDAMSERITRYSNGPGDGLLAIGADTVRKLVSERDELAALVAENLQGMQALASRVRELEGALKDTYEAIVLSKADFQQFFQQANAGNLKVAGISIMDAEMRLTASAMQGRAALSASKEQL